MRVTQLYFERQQLLLEIACLPPRDGHEAIGRHVRLAEIEAVLTGLTGLPFARTSTTTRAPWTRRNCAHASFGGAAAEFDTLAS